MSISARRFSSTSLNTADRCLAGLSHLPPITLLLSCFAIVLHTSSALGDLLLFDRTAIAAGEYWRLFTGHLTHWSTEHLIWDVFMFVLLASMIEKRGRVCLLATMLASTGLISATIWICQTEVTVYRGLSGLDSALFTFVLMNLVRSALRQRQPLIVGALIVFAAGFVGKLLWELVTGSTLFVNSSAAGFTPLPLVHAAGGIAGILAWATSVATRLTRRRAITP